ncbi:hypothetical protein [Pseudomonas typographi]|uniref:Uncharacterized protein n=1 Tax=Pseudomonas typographi TaxID=2715964 RepID=A0ABR7Z3I1_9PSED|nr:hypothetical protein [Pseudomonas typographi]MBD1588540.1 hypothetical protein [Pseudomonas typographi]MBD1599841.1 hypothetical protein [Pseudomonas typographi]
MTRAQRRHDTRRIKARFYAKQKVHECWSTTERNAGLFANHGKICSCWTCGNPRKLGELTMQEKRADLSEVFD